MANELRKATPISAEEAKAEVDSINAEIAKSKGIDPATGKSATEPKDPEPSKTVEDIEPAGDDKQIDPEKDNKADPEPDDEDKEIVTPKPRRQSRVVPISKYQELTTILGQKDTRIAELEGKLSAHDTAVQRADKLKKFVEVSGMSEEASAILFDTFGNVKAPALDAESKEVIDQAKIAIKKQEAEEAFKTEFDGLLKHYPDAEEKYDAVRAAAFKPENLNKSIYEVYLEDIDPEPKAPRRGAEPARGGGRRETNAGKPDYAQLARDVQANKPDVVKSLTLEQQDEFFDYLEKNGSRYSSKRI